MTETKTEIIPSPIKISKRCSDYTDDCVEVRDHFYCWLGINGTCDQADGLCPFIHTNN
jgi:hypothetical protein